MTDSPRQTELDLTPEYVEESGVKHSFNGTLFIPLPGQSVPPPPPTVEEVCVHFNPGVMPYTGPKTMKMHPLKGLRLGGHV